MRSLNIGSLGLVVALAMSHPVIGFWGSPSTTDYLVRLQALSFIKEVPEKLKEIDQNEAKATSDRAAVKKEEMDKKSVAKGKLIEKIDGLNKAIETANAPFLREIEKQKGQKKAELEQLRAELAENQAELEKAKAALVEDAQKFFFQGKSGVTKEEIDDLDEKFEETKAAVEKVEADLLKIAATEPSKDLEMEVMWAQLAKRQLESDLDSLAKSVALPEEQKARYQAQRVAWKKAAACMVAAGHCKGKKSELKAGSYEEIAGLKSDLERCAKENLNNASKATNSEQEGCVGLNIDSSVEKVSQCVENYRANVLQKAERVDTYKEYDDCRGMATVE